MREKKGNNPVLVEIQFPPNFLVIFELLSVFFGHLGCLEYYLQLFVKKKIEKKGK